MKLIICENTKDLGLRSARHAAAILREAIGEKGSARLLLSTGASQFAFFEALSGEDVDWEKVEMFHLDEYVGISDAHPASFKRYLLDRFVNRVHPGKYHLMDGKRDPEDTIRELTALLREAPIDLGMIGIGENAHIAFNDPPASFDDTCAYKVVTLAERCLQQQVGEGWFKSTEECFKQAISMTCPEIMKCRHIISVVPYPVKAEAVYKTLSSDISPEVPATLMKRHGDCTIYVDRDSAAMLTPELIAAYE